MAYPLPQPAAFAANATNPLSTLDQDLVNLTSALNGIGNGSSVLTNVQITGGTGSFGSANVGALSVANVTVTNPLTAGRCIIGGGTGSTGLNAGGTGGTQHIPMLSSGVYGSAAQALSPLPYRGTVRNFSATVASAPGAGQSYLVIFNGGSNVFISANITGANISLFNTTDTANLSAQSLIYVTCISSANAAVSSVLNWTAELDS